MTEFIVGQTVYLNEKLFRSHGAKGKIDTVKKRGPAKYGVQWGEGPLSECGVIWHSIEELSMHRIKRFYFELHPFALDVGAPYFKKPESVDPDWQITPATDEQKEALAEVGETYAEEITSGEAELIIARYRPEKQQEHKDKLKNAWRNDHATEKQRSKIVALGGDARDGMPKGEASDLIDSLLPRSCHYCGMSATGVGFFGEPVCHECS